MKKIMLSALALVCVLSASAQQKWTLRQCIDYAVENNIELKRSELTVEGAKLDLNTSRNSRLPSFSVGMGQNFSFGRSISDDTNGYVNTQSSNTSISASANVSLFNGFSINNRIKSDKFALQAAAEGLERARQSLELTVAGYYLDVLLQKEILAVYREQTALTRAQVANTAKMVEEGSVPRSQLYDIEAQLAQNEVNEINAANILASALLNLSQALNLEYTPDFDIAGIAAAEFAPSALMPIPSPDDIYATSVGIKPSVKEAELNLESSRLQVKIAKAAWWPSLSLGASFGDGYYYMFGRDNQQSFLDQIRNKHSQSVGLNLSIPIFNQNRTRNNVRAAHLAVANYTLQLEGVKLALYKEIQQAYQGAVAAGSRYEATTKALTAAQEAFRAMEMRYNNQKATAYEYSESNTRLISSRSEQAQAKYDYLFSTKILDFYRGMPIEI